ncbi:MAG: sulfotransferase domain-containing protein [Azospirillaceae bacterium]|nr:sulfotransferase domain-containing protein [Azospirillaceae bacterium]
MTGGRFGWLVSYPKSGNTWLRLMLSCVLSGGAAVNINATAAKTGVASFAEMDEFLGIESSELTETEIAAAMTAFHAEFLANSDAALLLRKVHDRFWRTPAGIAAFVPDLSIGAIYLIRDPRDVAISWSHHYGVSIDAIIERMADDGVVLGHPGSRGPEQLPQPLGSWSGHVLSWIEQGEIPALVIRYEDMLREPRESLARAAAHLGIATTTGLLDSAVSATRFDHLQRQEQAAGFRERLVCATAPFFREGRAGCWRDQLSAAQIARITRDHGAVMARFGYL